MEHAPYISVIVSTARDSNRLDLFTRAWIDQAQRCSLDSELIVALWGGPPGPRRLPVPGAPSPELRFIDFSDQAASLMMSKNAAIRRARGEFVLSTSIDTMFSEEFVKFLAAQRLAKGRLYRAQGCDDFILMAREHWMDVRGYAELDRAPRHLDTLLCHAACQTGVLEEILPGPARACHDEEPESGVPIPDAEIAWLLAQMRELQAPLIFNTDDWGLAGCELFETEPAACGSAMIL